MMRNAFMLEIPAKLETPLGGIMSDQHGSAGLVLHAETHSAQGWKPPNLTVQVSTDVLLASDGRDLVWPS